MQFNLHTHTKRCHHASNEDEEYVLRAIETKMDTLGFSDHIAFKHDPTSKIRMSYEEVDEYIDSIHRLKEKYKDKITIYCGFESEYIEMEYDFYEEIRKKVDYLILGPHFYTDQFHPSSRIETHEQMDQYVKMLEKAIQSNLFTYIAHPDIFLCNQKDLDDYTIQCIHRIADLAIKYNMVLEYNIEGYRDHLRGRIWPNGTTTGYPRDEFWQIIASYSIPVILGSDAHEAESLNDEATLIATQNAHKLGLNIIDRITLK